MRTIKMTTTETKARASRESQRLQRRRESEIVRRIRISKVGKEMMPVGRTVMERGRCLEEG